MNKREYTYHFGNELYKDIKSIYLQDELSTNLKIKELKDKNFSDDYINNYIKEVNVFPNEVKFKYINKLIKNGFKVWSNFDKLYMYTIDLKFNSSNIDVINVTSTEEQSYYDDVNWKILLKKTENMNDENFIIEKLKYLNERKKYLNSKGISKSDSVNEYLKKNIQDRISDMEYFFNKNIKCGRKTQYASCIPHLQLTSNQPLIYSSFQIMTKEYTIKELDESYLKNILKLYINSFKRKYTEKDIKKMFSNKYLFFGIFTNKDDKLIGLTKLKLGKKKDFLDDVDVIKNLKNSEVCFISDLISIKNGYGTHLMNYIFDYLKFKNIDIFTNSINKNTMKFYNKFNFKLLKIDNKRLLMKYIK